MGYTKLDLNGAFLPKPIDLVSSNFASYKTLRSINLKKNAIVEFNQRTPGSPVATLPFLLHLDLRQNQITSLASLNRKPAEGEETVYWPRLQHVYLGSNLIDKISPIGCPNLILLDVSGNKINQIQEGDDGFKGHDSIQELDISNNLLTNLGSLNGLKKLTRLYASGNRVFKFSGLEGCEELEFILLRDNAVRPAHQLTVFESTPPLPKLKYLNLRGNSLAKWEEIEKIKSFPALETVVLSFNPFINDCKDSYVFQLVSKFNELKQLKRINKHPLTMDIRAQTFKWLEDNWKVRVQKERDERDRKEREEREREERERKDADK